MDKAFSKFRQTEHHVSSSLFLSERHRLLGRVWKVKTRIKKRSDGSVVKIRDFHHSLKNVSLKVAIRDNKFVTC